MDCDSATHMRTQEFRQVLENLLIAFLAASPQNADLPIVRQARDLVGGVPHSSDFGVWSAFEPQARTTDDVPASFIKGCD